MPPRFLQLHFLTSYSSTLLNRDDAGFAKRIPFGGVSRTRISSQCLKRHWRTFEGEHSLASLGVEGSVRSRHTFERFIATPLESEGIDGDLARSVTEEVMAAVLGQSAKAKKAQATDDSGEAKGLQTGQITVLGRPEVEFLLGEARAICEQKPGAKDVKAAVKSRFQKEAKKNLEALKHASGLDAAVFGRMVTSDILARGDAAVHVAHAFTVHAEAAESDYFSAVDDLLQTGEDEQLGSGHIGTTELTSGLFYGYAVVDVPLLISNLEGCEPSAWLDVDRDLAARVVSSFVHLVATVSPGAKLGSTAPYSWAHLVIAEAGNAQPRTLANAFLKPVAEEPDLVANTYAALNTHLLELDKMYGATSRRKVAGIGPAQDFSQSVGAGDVVALGDLADWAAQQIKD